MARLVLATVFVTILVAALAIVVLGSRELRRVPSVSAGNEETSPMQKIAFALLVALIVYVAVQGAAA